MVKTGFFFSAKSLSIISSLILTRSKQKRIGHFLINPFLDFKKFFHIYIHIVKEVSFFSAKSLSNISSLILTKCK